MPVILGAATTDIIYALLAAAGLIVFDAAGIAVAHLLAAGFCLVAAVLMWAYRRQPYRLGLPLGWHCSTPRRQSCGLVFQLP